MFPMRSISSMSEDINSVRENVKYDRGHSFSEELSSPWYFSKEEILNSPSRKDGIELRREIYLQRSYSTFLQDLGMRLGLSQIIIATAITLCHRFFHRQSHKRYDRTKIATASMILSGKAEGAPRSVNEVLAKSYDILSRKDPLLREKKNQTDFCQEQRQLVLNAEFVLLKTLGFDVAVYHPYRLLQTIINKFGIAEAEGLTLVAWNMVNDGLRTSMWLQYRPREIAAGSIFLAARLMHVKLPLHWWETFQICPKILEETSIQLLELYEETNYHIASSGNQGGRSGERTKIAGKGEGYFQKDAKGRSSISANQPKDNMTKISDENAFRTLQLNANQMKSLASQERKIQCDWRRDQIKSGISFEAMETTDKRSSTSTSQVDEQNTSRDRQAKKIDISKLENASTSIPRVDEQEKSSLQDRKAKKNDISKLENVATRTPQVDEQGKRSLQDRQAEKIDVNKPGEKIETKSGIQSDINEQLTFVDTSCVNAEKIAELKRKHKEGKQLKPDISGTKPTDVEEIIELELERGVEEAAKAENAKQEKNEWTREKYRSKSCSKLGKESEQEREEFAGRDGNSLNRKTCSEDISNKDTISDKIRISSSKETVLYHQGEEMLQTDDPHDRLEEGEIPNCPAKLSNKDPSQVSNQPETGKESIKWCDYSGPVASKHKNDSNHAIMRGSYDRRVSRSHHYPPHSTDHHGRDYSRERKRSRDRNWEEQRDRARDWKRPTDRNWEENIYKRRRRVD